MQVIVILSVVLGFTIIESAIIVIIFVKKVKNLNKELEDSNERRLNLIEENLSLQEGKEVLQDYNYRVTKECSLLKEEKEKVELEKIAVLMPNICASRNIIKNYLLDKQGKNKGKCWLGGKAGREIEYTYARLNETIESDKMFESKGESKNV